MPRGSITWSVMDRSLRRCDGNREFVAAADVAAAAAAAASNIDVGNNALKRKREHRA